MTKQTFDKGFIPRLVGEDLETNLDNINRKQKRMLDKDFRPLDHVRERQLKLAGPKVSMSLAELIGIDMAAELKQRVLVDSWEEFDARRNNATANILELTAAFQAIMDAAKDDGLTDPKALKLIVDEYRSRLGRIKFKGTDKEALGFRIHRGDMVAVEVMKLKGLTLAQRKYIAG